MMTRTPRQDGFTLVELLVTITMAMVVFGATLNALDVFSNDSQGMTQRNVAQNQARLAMDTVIRQLRNIASPIAKPTLLERATPYDIVFQTVGTPSGGNLQGTERVRYCIPQDTPAGSPSTEVMYAQTQTWTTATPPTNTMSTSACPDPSTSYKTAVIASGVTNRYRGAARPAFTFNGGTAPSDLTTIDTVGIDLFVNPTPSVPGAETELESSAYLRNQERPPVASFTYTPLGGGAVLLNAGTSYSPLGETLSYDWSCTGSTCSSSGAVFDWKPGTGAYTVTLTVTDPAGVHATTSQQVTVT